MKTLAFLLLLSLPLATHANTTASFVDACSGQEVKVSTPNGVKLALKIDELDPEDTVNVTIQIRPSLPTDSLSEDDIIEWNYSYGSKSRNWRGRSQSHISSLGIFETSYFLPKERWMKKIAEKHNGFNVWDAEVTWSQPKSRNAGSAFATFYNAPSEGPYFQILSERICHWEGLPSVASKVYENNGHQTTMIVRQTSTIWEQGSSRGMTLGYNNYQGNVHPLTQFDLSTGFLGWVFKDWQHQAGTQFSSAVERTYWLKRNEAGVFVTRLSFARHEARKFEWSQRTGQCGEFVPVSQGYLDVGILKQGDFVVLPSNITGHTAKITEFIQKTLSNHSNCAWRPARDLNDVSEAIPSGKNGMLYYYIR